MKMSLRPAFIVFYKVKYAVFSFNQNSFKSFLISLFISSLTQFLFSRELSSVYVFVYVFCFQCIAVQLPWCSCGMRAIISGFLCMLRLALICFVFKYVVNFAESSVDYWRERIVFNV